MEITTQELLDYVKEHFKYSHLNGGLYYRESRGPRKKGSRAGSVNKKTGYRVIGIGGAGKQKIYSEHRLVFLLFNDRFPKLTRHKNGNKADNRIHNIIEITHQQNTSSRKNSSSKYRGVRRLIEYQATGDRVLFIAQIYAEGKNRHIGRFDNEDDAALAYNEKAVEFFGEYAFLNEVKTLKGDS